MIEKARPMQTNRRSTKILLLLLIVGSILSAPGLSAHELEGRISDTQLGQTGVAQDSTTTSTSHPLPSWFGVANVPMPDKNTSTPPAPAHDLNDNSKSLTIDKDIEQQQDRINRLSALIASPLPASSSNAIDHPDWIPAHAYTNADMIMNYFNLCPLLRFGQPIPASGQNVRLFKSITCYWRAGRYGNCETYFSPIYGHPGNFTFFTVNDMNGPHGWVQDTGQRQHGTHLYRIWFDQ